MMRRTCTVLFSAIALAGLLTANVSAQRFTSLPTVAERERLFEELNHDVDALSKTLGILKRVVRLTAPSVVHIDALKGRQGGIHGSDEEAGSGVIVQLDKTHYVITNRHVIRDTLPSNILITLWDRRELHPRQVWEDLETDIAVMQVEAPRLIPARFGDSSRVAVGDFVVANGSPFNLRQSISYGIVSALGRRDLDLGSETNPELRFQDFIQTDAAINPGNSGGPLFNLRAELIGINTAIASASGGNEGIGFAIPSKMVTIVARQLISQGRVDRAWLGVHLDNGFDADDAQRIGLPHPYGAEVSDVRPDSPASRAGLQVGDVVVKFGDVPVEDVSHLIYLVALSPVGTEVGVVVYRDQQFQELTVSLSERRPRQQ